MDKPLTSFTPFVINQLSGLSPKDLTLYFSFAGYLAIQGIVSLGTPPLHFLLGWRTFPESWRSGFGQALPDDRRAPEGLGA
jgi:hypothetical protein